MLRSVNTVVHMRERPLAVGLSGLIGPRSRRGPGGAVIPGWGHRWGRSVEQRSLKHSVLKHSVELCSLLHGQPREQRSWWGDHPVGSAAGKANASRQFRYKW